MSAEQNSVVVTGIGLATPLGLDPETVWARISRGETAIKPMPHYLPGRGGALIENFKPQEQVQPRRILKFINRATCYALVAARNAWEDAGLSENAISPDRFGIYTGTGESEMKPEIYFPALDGAVDAQGNFDIEYFAKEGLDRLNPYTGLTSLGNNTLCYVSIAHKLMGPSNNYVKSGVASSQAIGEATRILQYGYADAVMVVGVDWLTDPWAITAYDSIGMLCTDTWDVEQSMRPFDVNRKGLMPGEGAGALILERASIAKERNARIYGHILGYGEATDAFSLGSMPINGGVLPNAIAEAISDANIAPEQIDVIIPHGNASPVGDVSEARGIARAVGGQLCQTPVTATKAYSGHMGAASGIVETIFALLMSQHSTIPHVLNLVKPDENCPLNFVMHQPIERKVNVAMHIARSVGGQNAVVIIGTH